MLRKLARILFPPRQRFFTMIDGEMVALPNWVGPRTLNALAG